MDSSMLTLAQSVDKEPRWHLVRKGRERTPGTESKARNHRRPALRKANNHACGGESGGP